MTEMKEREFVDQIAEDSEELNDEALDRVQLPAYPSGCSRTSPE